MQFHRVTNLFIHASVLNIQEWCIGLTFNLFCGFLEISLIGKFEDNFPSIIIENHTKVTLECIATSVICKKTSSTDSFSGESNKKQRMQLLAKVAIIKTSFSVIFLSEMSFIFQ